MSATITVVGNVSKNTSSVRFLGCLHVSYGICRIYLATSRNRVIGVMFPFLTGDDIVNFKKTPLCPKVNLADVVTNHECSSGS
jgi:hypothetical protein